MNRFKLIFATGIAAAGFVSHAAYAVCEAEIENAAKNIYNEMAASGLPAMQNMGKTQADYFRNEMRAYYDSMKGHPAAKLNADTAYLENYIQRLRSGTSAGGQTGIENAQVRLCITRARLAELGAPNRMQPTQPGPQATEPTLSDAQMRQARSQSAQALQSAEKAQAKADRARQGKSKGHIVSAEASHCIALDKTHKLFGGFLNTCNFNVRFSSCNYKPRIVEGGFNWSADFDCEKQQFGLYGAKAMGGSAGHTHNTEMVYWFACRSPAEPVDVEFSSGSVRGRCN